jgi:hypothetical protein
MRERALDTGSRRDDKGKHMAYPIGQGNDKSGKKGTGGGTLQGSVLPANFKHYSHCSCYQPSPDAPKPSLEMAELEALSE